LGRTCLTCYTAFVAAFLSYSTANQVFAGKLREQLTRLGLTVWSDGSEPNTKWSERIEAGIRSASALLLLIGPRDGNGKDEKQELTWRVMLETVWQDEEKTKHLIPILLKDAVLPAFVLSAFKLSSMDGAEIPIIRVRNLRAVTETARAILKVVQEEVGPARRAGSDLPPPVVSPRKPTLGLPARVDVSFESSESADAGSKVGYSLALDEIEEFAKSLKR
jgi:TIR domain-containing protein